MRVKSAEYKDGRLCLEVPAIEAVKFTRKFTAGEYEITPAVKKRSLSANSYLWVLCDEIAKALRDGTTKVDVYRDYVKQVGIYRVYHLLPSEVDPFSRLWSRQGIGWVVEPVDFDGKHQTVFAYYGSSTYNVKQMSRLLDRIVQDCREYGIETLEDERIKELIESWEAHEK